MTTTVPALQIFTEGGAVEIRTTVDNDTHTLYITPREAHTLATFTEWLLEESERDLPSTLGNLPDHMAVELDYEDCPDCPVEHERPVLLVAVAVGEGLADVRTIELRSAEDFLNLPYFLNFAAVAANPYQEPTNV